MAQTTLNIYPANQIFNYVTRLLGTLIGLVFGLAAWYRNEQWKFIWDCCYGRSCHYPTDVHAVPGWVFLDLRTYYAIRLSRSWLVGRMAAMDTHGYRFRRVLHHDDVPPPKSSRSAVRQRNASSIASLGSAYGSLISTWIANHDDGKDAALPAAWSTDFSALIALAEEMHTIRELTGLAKWEGSFRRQWPAEEYTKLIGVQVEMIASLTQSRQRARHSGTARNFKPEFLSFLVVGRHGYWIADVTAIFTLVSQSLRTGEPMSQVLPHSILERLVYHYGRTLVSAVIIGHGIDVQQIKSLSYTCYASAVVVVYQLLVSYVRDADGGVRELSRGVRREHVVV
ncbi:hypothetical protein C8J57DRAFT_1609376 [Mycena rebaudengoi]|nr:hypothetical protein C8J57DRAFT_1609376 [Mycena rebaudengoi]